MALFDGTDDPGFNIFTGILPGDGSAPSLFNLSPLLSGTSQQPSPDDGSAPTQLAMNTTSDASQFPMDDYLARTRQIESSGGKNIKGNSSSALGDFQFTKGTWAQVRANHPELNLPVSVSTDPAVQRAAAQALTQDNISAFQNAQGRLPTPAEAYLMHQQGSQGGLTLLGNPDEPAGSLLSYAAIKNNGGDPSAPASNFVQKWTNVFNNTKPSASSVSTPPQPASNSTAVQNMDNSTPSTQTGGTGTPQSFSDRLSALSTNPMFLAGLQILSNSMTPHLLTQSVSPLNGVPNVLFEAAKNKQAQDLLAQQKTTSAAISKLVGADPLSGTTPPNSVSPPAPPVSAPASQTTVATNPGGLGGLGGVPLSSYASLSNPLMAGAPMGIAPAMVGQPLPNVSAPAPAADSGTYVDPRLKTPLLNNGQGISNLPNSAVVTASNATASASQPQAEGDDGGDASADTSAPAPPKTAASGSANGANQAPAPLSINTTIANNYNTKAARFQAYQKQIATLTSAMTLATSADDKAALTARIPQLTDQAKQYAPTDWEQALSSLGAQPGDADWTRIARTKAGVMSELDQKINEAFPDPNDPRRQQAYQAAVSMGPTDATKKLNDAIAAGIIPNSGPDYVAAGKTIFGLDKNKDTLPTYGVVRKDPATNADVYGWRDPNTMQVQEYNPSSSNDRPDNSNLTGPDFLQSIAQTNPNRAALIKGIADGTVLSPSGSALRSPQNQVLMGQVIQYDPTFDQTNPAARFQTRKDFTAGGPASSAATITTGNTALNHLLELSDASENLPNSSFKPINALTNMVGANTGDTAITHYNNILTPVVDEMLKFYKGSAGTRSEMEDWLNDLSPNMSLAQRRDAIAEKAKLMQSRTDALQQKWHNGMGPAASDFPIFTNKSQEAIDKIMGRQDPNYQPQFSDKTSPASSAPSTITQPMNVPQRGASSGLQPGRYTYDPVKGLIPQ